MIWQFGYAKDEPEGASLGEKLKVLGLLRKEKKVYAEVAEIYGKNGSALWKIVEKDKQVHASFIVT